MAEVRRVRATWTGLAGTPYLSTWWFESETGQVGEIVTAVRKFLTSCRPAFSNGLTVNLEADQGIFNADTGDLIGVESASPGAAITGTASGEVLPLQCQTVLKLATGGIVNNRRVRGRFFIPAPTELISDGTPLATLKGAVNAAAATLIVDSVATGAWVVYSRPIKAEDIKPGSDVVPRAGSIHNVQAATAWNKFGIQRRRRD